MSFLLKFIERYRESISSILQYSYKTPLINRIDFAILIISQMFLVCCDDPKTGAAAGIRTQISSWTWNKKIAERILQTGSPFISVLPLDDSGKTWPAMKESNLHPLFRRQR